LLVSKFLLTLFAMITQTRKPTAERRKEIAESVLRIIGERGLTSLTTTTIAAEVGLTSGALFRHFVSRDEMLTEAVRFGLARIEDTFPNESLLPIDRLMELARGRIRVLGSDAGLAWLFRSEQAFLELPGEAVTLLREIVERSTRYVLEALREGAALGTIRRDIEPEVLLVPVMGTIHALIGAQGARKLSTGRARDPEPVLAALVRLLEPVGKEPAAPESTNTDE
jgi:TetR/AcrR family transcriptional regulator